MIMNKLRIIFFGTPEFAVNSADAIFKAGYDIAAVVTMPDKEAGRGHKLFQSPVKQWALKHSIPVLQPVKLKDSDFINELKAFGANLFVVIAFRMLPEVVWSMPELGTFNLHASLLPDYRGAAPINWALINGEKETGVTTFFLQHEIDTGDVIMQEKIAIDDCDDAGTLHDKLIELGAKVTLATLRSIEAGNYTTQTQASLGGCYKTAPKIFHETCFIDWNKTSREIINFVRGLSPYPAARAMLQFPKNAKEEYKVFQVMESHSGRKIQPGEAFIEKDKLLIGCADGCVEILSLQPQGKRRMDVKDFLNGLRI